MNSFIDLFLKTVADFDKNLLLNVKYDLKIKTNKDFLKKTKENRHIDLVKNILLLVHTKMTLFFYGIIKK